MLGVRTTYPSPILHTRLEKMLAPWGHQDRPWGSFTSRDTVGQPWHCHLQPCPRLNGIWGWGETHSKGWMGWQRSEASQPLPSPGSVLSPHTRQKPRVAKGQEGSNDVEEPPGKNCWQRTVKL